MVFRGHVKNGRVELDEPSNLPEGAVVEVTVNGPLRSPKEGQLGPTLYERLAPVIGKAKGLPADLAKNHDHYLHGSPMKT